MYVSNFVTKTLFGECFFGDILKMSKPLFSRIPTDDKLLKLTLHKISFSSYFVIVYWYFNYDQKKDKII